MTRYIIEYGYNAPDLLMSSNTGGDVRKLFFKGDIVFGKPSAEDAGMVILENRYLIPASNLKEADTATQVMNSEAYRDVISQGQSELGLKEKESEALALTLTGKGANVNRSMLDSYRRGAIVGLIGGAVLAMYFQKKVWVWALGGMIAGGYLNSKIKNIQLKTSLPK